MAGMTRGDRMAAGFAAGTIALMLLFYVALVIYWFLPHLPLARRVFTIWM